MLNLYADYRIGGRPRLYLAETPEIFMRVPDEIRKCVVFLLAHKNGKGLVLAGTGFFVGYNVTLSFGKNLSFIYLVTAKHVIEEALAYCDDASVHIRINLHGVGATTLKTAGDQWKSHPDKTVDIAVCGHLNIPQSVYDYLVYPLDGTATSDVIAAEKIGVGDEVFLTGLFTAHFGKDKNLPVVRIGSIAAMPEEKVATIYGETEAYLAEMRSMGGLSGSPVFVHIGNPRMPGVIVSTGRTSAFYLLGLIHGRWNFQPKEVFIDDLEAGKLYMEAVNMGIATVMPAHKIKEFIMEYPHFVDDRNRNIDDENRKNLPTPDSALSDDDTPYTKEDFERALDNVMRRGDETPDPESSETSE